MGKFLLLAFRNVFRNRRRTIMTLFMVSGGVAGLLLAGGYFAHMIDGLRESTIRNGLGHIQIFTAAHFQRDEVHVLDTGIDNWQRVAATVKTVLHVRGVAPRIEFYGMVSNGQKSSVFMGSAVDPDAERSLGFTSEVSFGPRSRQPSRRRSRSHYRRRPREVDERWRRRRSHSAFRHRGRRAERRRCPRSPAS
jgi:putative ABC transport system permease protein